MKLEPDVDSIFTRLLAFQREVSSYTGQDDLDGRGTFDANEYALPPKLIEAGRVGSDVY